MTQRGPFSDLPIQASPIPLTPSRTVPAARHQKRTPTPSPGDVVVCPLYDTGTFFYPNAGQTLRPGHTYNVSYYAGIDVKDDAVSNLAPIGITNEGDGGDLLLSIDVPRVTVTFQETSFDEHGQYVASWTTLDDCGNSAQNFTWTIPTNLHELYPNATTVNYRLFYSFDNLLDSQTHNGMYTPEFAIKPLSTPTPSPRPTSSDSHPDPQKGGGGSKGLSGGAKAGIAVGVIVAVALLAWLVLKRYKAWAARVHQPWHKPELPAEEPKPGRQSPPPVEIDSSPRVYEADGRPMIWEVDGRSSLQNVDGSGRFRDS